MSFAAVIGQERAKALAESWLRAGRLPHAILVCGPEGTGKRRFALELAKAIVCREGGCGRCSACRRVENLVHPDVHALMPLPPARGHKKEEVQVLEEQRAAVLEYVRQNGELARSNANIAREHLRQLQREMAFAPVEATRKVGLVLAAECMHPAGANSLLKILEEPPGRAVFVLVSSVPERLLPTVLSRCQRLHLQRLSREALRAHFGEKGLEGERLELAVRMGQGSLQRAAQTAEGGFDELRQRVEAFLRAAVLDEDDEGYWEWLDEAGGERGALERFLELLGLYLRDLFLMAWGRGQEIALVDRRTFLDEVGAQLTAETLEAAAVEVDRAFDYLSRNVHLSLVGVDMWRCLRRDRQRARA